MVPTPTTNLLAMPLVSMQVNTGNNEDWVDSILYTVDVTGAPQLDLRGIAFEMEVRRQPPDNEVVIRASTDDGTLAIGDPPNFGYLLISIPHDKMKIQGVGNYVADIVGIDAQHQRTVVQMTILIFEGLTRP
jgi:hypothetical protein